MTAEKRRALIIIGATFIIGILVGILAAGIWNKYTGTGRRPIGWSDGGRERFIQKILTVVEADSAQARQMRPLLNQTMTRIDSLHSYTDREVHAVVDSLEILLQPILNPEQQEKMRQFHARGRERRRQ